MMFGNTYRDASSATLFRQLSAEGRRGVLGNHEASLARTSSS
jgi:hypothetical protein